jgi:hypothetical protein
VERDGGEHQSVSEDLGRRKRMPEYQGGHWACKESNSDVLEVAFLSSRKIERFLYSLKFFSSLS